MLLDVTCKAGKLQISEDGFVRVRQSLTGSIVWQIPCNTITRITSQNGFAMSSNIIFHSYEFNDKCVHEPVFGGERLSSQDALLKTCWPYSHPLSHCL